MFDELIDERVTLVVASKGDTILEYVGTLNSEDEETV